MDGHDRAMTPKTLLAGRMHKKVCGLLGPLEPAAKNAKELVPRPSRRGYRVKL